MRRLDHRPKNFPRKYPYGVAYRKRKSPYIVKFRLTGKNIHVGCYKTLAEAAAIATDYARNVLHVVL